MTHICISKRTIIGSDNGLSHGWRQAINWTNAGILWIRTLGTIFSDILIKIHKFSFKKMHLEMSSGNWLPFCLGLNVLKMAHTIAIRHYMKLSTFVISANKNSAGYSPIGNFVCTVPVGMNRIRYTNACFLTHFSLPTEYEVGWVWYTAKPLI